MSRVPLQENRAPTRVFLSATAHRVLSGVVVQILHEDVHTVYSEVVAILQRRPALVISATDADIIIGCTAGGASAAILGVSSMPPFRIANLRFCVPFFALQQGVCRGVTNEASQRFDFSHSSHARGAAGSRKFLGS